MPDLLAAGMAGAAWTMTGGSATTRPGSSYHSRLLVVATSAIRKVITEGRRLSIPEPQAISGRCGLILSGPARTGKTTAITQLGKTIEVMHRSAIPAPAGHPRHLHHRAAARPPPR